MKHEHEHKVTKKNEMKRNKLHYEKWEKLITIVHFTPMTMATTEDSISDNDNGNGGDDDVQCEKPTQLHVCMCVNVFISRIMFHSICQPSDTHCKI